MTYEREREGAGGAETDPAVTTVELDTVLARRATRRGRLLWTLLVAVPLLAIATLLVQGTLVPALSEKATPAVPTVNNLVNNQTDPVTIMSNTSFGTLTLNGKRLSGALPYEAYLRSGMNTLIFDAPPFQRKSCVVRGPLVLGGPGSDYDPVVATPGQQSACVFNESTSADGSSTATLTFPLTGGDLPADLQAQARAAIAAVVAAQAPQVGTVPVGFSYATGLDARGIPTSQRATEPLSASLSYSLSPPSSSATHAASSFPCTTSLCASNLTSQPFNPGSWDVEVPLDQDWHFTTMTGTPVGQVTFPDAGQALFALAYDRTTGWHLAQGSSSGLSAIPQVASADEYCMVGEELVLQVLTLTSSAVAMPMTLAPGVATGAQLPACDIGPIGLGTGQVQFVWQFGALSAADAQTQTLAPSLPLATAAEIAAISG